jgi:hypothetical protein
MPTGRILGALLAVLPALSLADASVPETPAGHALDAWLDAFNSADRAREESFIKTYAWETNLDDLASWRAETGGYDLLDIYSNDQTTVFFRVKARTNGAEEVGRVTVSATAPVAVTELGTWRIPADAKVDVVKLDATARTNVIDRVAGAFDSFYVYPEIGKKMSAALRKRNARGAYRFVLYGIDLARELTRDLREISHDKHVEVRFSFFVRPAELSTKQPEAESRRLAAINCGFEKAEHLRPNIGYLKFNMFADPEICAPTAAAAMTFLADSDALVLDLRDNRGGHGGMVEFIASYLFDQHTHLDDMFSRAENATNEAWTLPYVPGKKFVGKPVFVLTSKQTFSAAESLSYSLKNLKRATLIGETTLGGAHPTETKPIDDHFSVRVPYARSISPITKTNWEGTGVEPDVKVAADQALDVALKLAAEEISKNRSKPAR